MSNAEASARQTWTYVKRLAKENRAQAREIKALRALVAHLMAAKGTTTP